MNNFGEKKVEITSLNCPNCGSADTTVQQKLDRGLVLKCSYCNTTSLVTVDGPVEVGEKTVGARLAKLRLEPGIGEFGIGGGKILALVAGGSLLLYAVGWLLEDTRYFLDTWAVLIWAGVLPLWLLALAAIWRTSGPAWLVGLAIALPILGLHTLIPTIIRGRFNDDYLGIGAIFAGAVLTGWLLGRWLHLGLRFAVKFVSVTKHD